VGAVNGGGRGSRVVERLAEAVNRAAGSAPRRVLPRATAIERQSGQTGGSLADTTGAFGIAVLGAAAAVLGAGAAVMGFEDLEGLLERRHGGGVSNGRLAWRVVGIAGGGSIGGGDKLHTSRQGESVM
jgi:hypothetical protein